MLAHSNTTKMKLHQISLFSNVCDRDHASEMTATVRAKKHGSSIRPSKGVWASKSDTETTRKATYSRENAVQSNGSTMRREFDLNLM
jgi:hypothetical protein